MKSDDATLNKNYYDNSTEAISFKEIALYEKKAHTERSMKFHKYWKKSKKLFSRK